LNGFTITGPGTNAGTNGVSFASPNGLTLDNATILGPGTITKFQDGIVFQVTYIHSEDLLLHRSRISAAAPDWLPPFKALRKPEP
jgi:hypothetical protein